MVMGGARGGTLLLELLAYLTSLSDAKYRTLRYLRYLTYLFGHSPPGTGQMNPRALTLLVGPSNPPSRLYCPGVRPTLSGMFLYLRGKRYSKTRSSDIPSMRSVRVQYNSS